MIAFLRSWMLLMVGLAAVSGQAEAQQKITVCSSGCSKKTINAAIAAASCGSWIVLSSSETFYGGDGNREVNNPIRLQYKNCAPGNPIVITTDQESRLPAPGTRITPNYADGAKRVVPLIVNPKPGMVLTTDVGNLACGGGSAKPCPAHDYELVGLEFCCSSDFSEFMGIGARGDGASDPAINTIADLPANITLDRVLVRADPLKNMRRCITFDAVNITIENSWIDCGFDFNSSDAQAIAGFSTKGAKILNNYIAGTTEPVAFSGACSPIRTPVKMPCMAAASGAIPTDIEVAFNEITKPAWVRMETWHSRHRFPKGQILRPGKGNSGTMRALEEGVTGDREPAWPAAVSGKVRDGDIEWVRTDAVAQAKNLLEAKSADHLLIHDNFFHEAWPQGQQGYAMTFTTNTSSAGAFGYLHDVRVEDNVIADAGSGINTTATDAHNDINALASIMPTKAAPYQIPAGANHLTLTIDGDQRDVTLPTGELTAQAVVNAIGPQIQPAMACVIGDRFVLRARRADDRSSCNRLAASGSGHDTSIAVDAYDGDASSALGFPANAAAQSCYNPTTYRWYGCGYFDGLLVKNNLWARINVEPNRAGVPYVFAIFNRLNHVTYTHNTVDANPEGGMRMFLLETPETPSTNVSIRDNILGFRQDNPHPITQGGTLYDFSAINYMLCNVAVTDKAAPADRVCPAGVVTHNIMPGVKLWNAETRDTRPAKSNKGINSYPSDNWDDSWSDLHFADAADLDYTLLNGKKFRATEPAGSTVGADMSELPLIRGMKVEAANQKAVFSFAVTKPIAAIPCVIRVSASPYMETVLPDLDPSKFERPDASNQAGNVSDGLNRTMTVGSRVPLTAGTTYYYQLSCGGATRYGSFAAK